MRPPLLVLCLSALLIGCSSQTAPPLKADPMRVKAHVEFLADDLLEGRETGTRGYDLAALYVANQMASMGLLPAGDGGSWMQRVPLIRGQRLADGARFVLHRNGSEQAFEFQTDYLPSVNYDQADWELRAPMVFVGQAVVAPEFDHDDLAGVDLTGKIALLFSGAPSRFPNDPRAYYASGRVKLGLLVERGAVGVVFLGDPVREGKYPWARGAKNWARPGMRLRDADDRPIDSYPQLVASASIRVDAVRRLFAGAEQEADSLFSQLEEGSLRAFELPGELELAGRSELSLLESANVVGQLPGDDPLKSTEHVVYSAHLDHIGIGAAVDGDSIYNGALDNALGVALLLETARLATKMPAVARSQVFIAVTGEEKGLLGSEYFAGQPSMGGEIVANINMDMPVVLSEQRDVLPIGIEHSELAGVVKDSAAQLGIELSADPFPEEVVFIRSDQFSFLRRGIPAVYIDGGVLATDPAIDGKQQLMDFLRTHYHQPSDEASLPIHYPSAARIADLNAAVGARVGEQAERPRWNEGDFFAAKFLPAKQQ